VKITITRAFLLKSGARQEPGSVIDVADVLARELIASGKAEKAADAPTPAPGPLTTETAPAFVKGKAKESANAGQ